MKIAVVVPFYKIDFFEPLIRALSRQTNKEFTVYVGNDASDTSAVNVCKKYESVLDIEYTYFDSRLGHVNLAGQWNRCISLVRDCGWVWVIPDDDLPSPDCISEIRNAAKEADRIGSNVIHIPMVTIDENGSILQPRSELPYVMCSGEFYLSQLKGRTSGTSLANAVYRKTAFESAGQFLSFPKGWGSDHATTLAVAAGGKIVTVPQAWLGFRMSGLNISSQTDDIDQKMQARLEFATWLARQAPTWYGPHMARQMLRWFYLKGELYVVQIWPFSMSIVFKLFDLSVICGVKLNLRRKAFIIVGGWYSLLRKRLLA